MHAIWFMLTALAVLAIAYRYYSAFIAAKVLALSPARVTPAHTQRDGHNFHPTNRWVLFGHHFAAITGAGPLIGPVLAAQFGFLPGYTWILFGVVFGGAVHDFVILVSSVRRGGRSLAAIAREELGPVLGAITGLAILFIVVIALAGLGKVVVGALAESAWGVFTIGLSIPIALGMGLYIYKVRGGSVQGIREATLGGVALLLLALVFGKTIQDGPFGHSLKLSQDTLTYCIAAYGFAASVLPVWLLLCPRDYLSSYLKIGTIGLLVIGIVIVNPVIEMPLLNSVTAKAVQVGGDTFTPIVKGQIFPFVFITIACGAISGFHSLVASGTTPKMVDQEPDCRAIGYGAMLMEGLVGITALIAATALPPSDYFAINTDPLIPIVAAPGGHGLAKNAEQLAALGDTLSPADRRHLGLKPGESVEVLVGKSAKASELLHLSNRTLAALDYNVDPSEETATELTHGDFLRLGIHVAELPLLAEESREVIAARTGGAVSLAVGMARVFSSLPGMKTLIAYWYHFAIMFEALFVLTTIDTGTRVGRLLLQEFVGRVWEPFGRTSWVPGSVLASLAIVVAWSYFILTGSISTIWPMFGIANQLLACTALAVGTTVLLKEAQKPRYALITLCPLLFVGTTTITAGFQAIFSMYLPMLNTPATHTLGLVNSTVTSLLLVGVIAILVGSVFRWQALLKLRASQVNFSTT
ncbi:MAG: carbon starvation protein A [Polyangiaceae bacterium]|nr:carbon starvation protein A [Polyangiaceae bacterium]